jgi:hypothetical protein
MQSNSAGTGDNARLVPIFFMCATRIGVAHPVAANLSPHGEMRADRRGRTERRYN